MSAQFNSRADQLNHVFLQFARYLDQVIEKSGGKTRIPIDQMGKTPAMILCGYACDIFNKYGDGLLSGDNTVLFRLVSEFSRATNMESMAQEAVDVCKYIAANKDVSDKFFLYVKVIHKLLEIDPK